MITALLTVAILATGTLSTVSDASLGTDALVLTSPCEFELDFSRAAQPPESSPPASGAPDADPPAEAVVLPGFGSAGSHWLTVGGATAYNFDEDYDFNLHFAWSTFLVDRLEFGVEATGWYFDQAGQNTAGLSGMFTFRYHFWSGPNGDFDWSAFGDVGTGMLIGFDEVPDGGTGFNFIQRAGFGITKDLDASDGPAHGARLVLGIRWHHISNGRFSGDGRNPARDSILAFVGVQWDF